MSAYVFNPHHHGNGDYTVVFPDGSVASAKPDRWRDKYEITWNDGTLNWAWRDGIRDATEALEILEDKATDMERLLEAALRMPKVA